MANSVLRFLRDTSGASLLEFTLVYPLIMLVVLGSIDVSLLMLDWAGAGKAAYVGARLAAVTDPVATGVTTRPFSTISTQTGLACFDPATGVASGTASCPVVTTVCTPANSPATTGGACTAFGGFTPTFNNAAFGAILTKMQATYVTRTLAWQNLQISYETTGLGFVGRPNGLPMNVTVSIRCMSHRYFFLGALMGWAFPALPAGCPPGASGVPMPPFSTTLPSEDLATN